MGELRDEIHTQLSFPVIWQWDMLQLTKPLRISPQGKGRLLASSKDMQEGRKQFNIILYQKER